MVDKKIVLHAEVDICLMIEIQLNKHQKHRDILNELRLVEGVRLIEEI